MCPNDGFQGSKPLIPCNADGIMWILSVIREGFPMFRAGMRGLLFASAAFVAGLFLSAAHAEPGQDHPLLNRYPGSVIHFYDFKEYEEAQLLLSRPQERGGQLVVDKLLPLEGKVTYIQYEAPDAASTFQVFRNYQAGLRRSGFKELFVCERPCGKWNLGEFKTLMKARDLYMNGSLENQYLSAQRGNTYVSLWVNQIIGKTQVFLFVIEKTALDDERIAVSGGSAIARALNENGRVNLYGFQFDTGEAVLKSSSAPTLKELGLILRDNPGLKLDIIGHTDDVGGAGFNQRLSEARARSVAAALAAQQHVDPDRLNAIGKGMSEALAPNTSEAGRAKNRRVEVLVRGSGSLAQADAHPAQSPLPSPSSSEGGPKSGSEGIKLPTINDANSVIDMARKIKDILRR